RDSPQEGVRANPLPRHNATQRNNGKEGVVWSADYDAFGQATLTTPAATAAAPTIESALRLPGQYEDTETGLHYNFHRYYDGQTARYIQADPLGLEGRINRYASVEGSPLGFSDPDGRARIPASPNTGTPNS